MRLSIRSMIRAPKGKVFVAFDLSQAESWVVAYLANEHNMKHALLYGDIHTETAGNALFFGDAGCGHIWPKITDTTTCTKCGKTVTKLMRYVGKRYNHASAYRMGANRAAEVINKDSDKPPYFTVTYAESKKFFEAWHSYYHLEAWWRSIEQQLSDTRTLTTPYGRCRTFYAIWGNELFKEATAFVPQSTVADHFNGATLPNGGKPGGLLQLYKETIRNYEDRKIINQSHDSALVELPKQDVEEFVGHVKDKMLRPIVINDESFTIPLDIEVGERWGELERYG